MKTRISTGSTTNPKTMVGCVKTICAFGLLLYLLALPAAVQAQYKYTTTNGGITITGYTGPGGDVAIPDRFPNTTNGLPVTSIGDHAFQGSTNLTSVTIGNNVTSIGEYAFNGCTELARVTIPGSVTSIGEYAFFACSSLTNVTIPDSVLSIGQEAFELSTSLTSVTIGNSVTNIGDAAFAICTGLTAITVDTRNSFYSDLDGVLFNKSLTALVEYPGGIAGSYTIPASVTSIGDNAFYDCTSLTSVTIPASVTSIGDYAFYDCTSLTSVTIPGSVTNIGMSAFQCCQGLISVTIGNGISDIRGNAFFGCESLTSVYFQGNAPFFERAAFNEQQSWSWTPATVYYLPGTTGWTSLGGELSSSFVSAVLWNPQVQTADGSFGVKSNQFGFNITGTSNFIVMVEASSDLARPTWSPLQTITLTNGTAHFSDPQWRNYPARIYRLNMP